jgi:hypothetical protein
MAAKVSSHYYKSVSSFSSPSDGVDAKGMSIGAAGGFGTVDAVLFGVILSSSVLIGVYHGVADGGGGSSGGLPSIRIRRRNIVSDVAFLFTSYMSMAVVIGE